MSECYKEVDKKCKCYKMITLKEVDIPQDLGEWCRSHGIEKVTIKAPMTDEQKADILRQVPTASIVQL
jgi:peroxiredoxin